MRIEFDTTEYESNHGAKPRGRGNWAFVDDYYARKANYLEFVFWAGADLTYADAKKAAAAHFRAMPGFSGIIVVCS
jgi:hypothetical protein